MLRLQFKLICLAVTTGWMAFDSPAQADFIFHYWENQYEAPAHLSFQINGMYYQTSSNFNSAGQVYSPTGLRSYSRFQSDLLARYGFAKNFSAFVRLSAGYVSLSGIYTPGAGFGLTDQTAGLSFRLFGSSSLILTPHSTVAVDLQAQVDFPVYNTTLSSTQPTPTLGDGSTDVSGGIFVTIPLSAFDSTLLSSQLGVGYTYRSSQFSAAVPWSATLEYTPYEVGLFARLAALGTLSLQTDPNNGMSAPARSSLGTGGSFATGGINSSLLTLRAQAGYKFNPMAEAFASVQQSVWGQIMPNGYSVTLGIQARIGRETGNPIGLTPRTYGKSNRGLLSYSLEAKVLKTNDRLNLVKIDKGSQDGIGAGDIFDIFLPQTEGSTGEAIARAKVVDAKFDESALKVIEYYKEAWIEAGFIARRLIQ